MKTFPEISVLNKILRSMVRGYQRVTANRPTPCRFIPTCSSYAIEALEKRGAIRGLLLTGGRLCRCHPWGGQGWDPVPLPVEASHPLDSPQGSTCST
ncbi:MAG: membrane protein insertion efficiency factor YidD [Acidimicrobiales bacterium]|jgi:hypothetical protein|nr:membrane protein insertion efficiency factor YidD [Acidimicrobiales bacterium]